MLLTLLRRFLPKDADPEAARLVLARGLRGFADGMVSVLLASYLLDLGFSAGQVGVLVTGTLLGSAALTLGVGMFGQAAAPRTILLGASGLMLATGLGFASITDFWPLLLVAVAGTLNPSNGDVSVFLPTEQAILSGFATGQTRTALFARYNLSGTFCAAFGALCAGVPVAIAKSQDWDFVDAQRSGFVLYAVVAITVAVIYRSLPRVEIRAAVARCAAGQVAKSCSASHGAVLHRFLRRRLRCPVSACAVAIQAIRPVGGDGWGDLLRGGPPGRVLTTGFRVAG